MTAPDLSVILVNWNALALTCAAIDSLRAHTEQIKYEVFVVDNGTTQDSSTKDIPTKYPWLVFISNSTNQGYTKANNQAICMTRGRYVLLLNNDTIQIENALGKSVSYMDANPAIGALGIRHLNNDATRTAQLSYACFPRPWREALALLGISRNDPIMFPDPSAEEIDVDWICGSFLLIRRSCLEAVGALDERFFAYDEDVDWCYRCHQAGWGVRFWSGASMIHIGSGAMPSIKDKTFMIFRSHLSYIFKNHGILAAGVFYFSMGARLAGATIWQALKLLTGRGNRDDLIERLTRQLQFMFLRSSRFGT